MEYNSLYKGKSKEQQGNKKERQKKNCVYAYNDGGNHRNGVQGMRGLGVRNDCDTGCGMTVIRFTECKGGCGMDRMRDEHMSQERPDDRSGYQQEGETDQGAGGR